MPDSLIDSVYVQALNVEPDNSRARILLLQNMWTKKEYDKIIAFQSSRSGVQPR